MYTYNIYSVKRQEFSFLNNPRKSRSILQDGSRFSGIVSEVKTNLLTEKYETDFQFGAILEEGNYCLIAEFTIIILQNRIECTTQLPKLA